MVKQALYGFNVRWLEDKAEDKEEYHEEDHEEDNEDDKV